MPGMRNEKTKGRHHCSDDKGNGGGKRFVVTNENFFEIGASI